MAGRNIILLSDGTGNSAATATKTNVWRLYKALRLRPDKQLAAYDDGVGTSGSTVLRALGGGVGLGLARNVRDLYTYLCEHYKDGDKVYVFGFSRGAFTARTLADMIVTCGILDRRQSIQTSLLSSVPLGTDAGLKASVKAAYCSYRRKHKTLGLAAAGAAARDLYFHTPDPSELPNHGQGEVEFIGVWDTVDAVGLPVDELSVVADRYIAPHRFPDQKLSEYVHGAAHAIAIDDERHTFHPVLWDESSPRDQKRIQQVWFAGMHANVGGGYPDDDLSYIPLQWMIDQAAKAGLDFDSDELDHIRLRANPFGKMHDSRAGAAVYYRYQPRRIADICNDPGDRKDRKDSVFVKRPKIHHTVLERIRESVQGYAPAGLPAEFDIVGPDGEAATAPPDLLPDHDKLDRAQSHIWWRRRFYFLFVFLTLSLLAFPHYLPATPGAKLYWPVDFILRFASPFLPPMLEHWTDSWTQSPTWFLCLVAAYGWAWYRGNKIAANALQRSEVGWWSLRGKVGPPPDLSHIGIFERLATRFRQSTRFQGATRWYLRELLPRFTLAICLLILAGGMSRLVFYYPESRGGVCAKAIAEEQADPGYQKPADIELDQSFRFETSNPCLDTGLELLEGRVYYVTVEALGDWKDKDTPAGVGGLSSGWTRLDPIFAAAIPLRRSFSLPWFTLTAEIRRDSGVTFPIPEPTETHNTVEFRAPATGRLHLYVNDGVNGLPEFISQRLPLGSTKWTAFYENNKGAADIKLSLKPPANYDSK